MRPTPGAAASHAADTAESAFATTPTATPMECFLTTESAIDASSETSSGRPALYRRNRRKRSAEFTRRNGRSPQPSPAPSRDSLASLSSCNSDLELNTGLSPVRSTRTVPEEPSGYSESASIISSTSSRRNSVLASHSSEDGGRPAAVSPVGQDQPRREAPPQFIMPSLAVPQRRPFSDTGKAIGKLKILIAGPSRTGKSSLVQAIAHCCEDIVHVDQEIAAHQPGFSEIWASTRPQPWWQRELDASSSQKRRRSSTADILDRNLCFVLGKSPKDSTSNGAEKSYVDAQMSPLLEKSMDDSDLSTIISGGGSSIVDAVFYMIPQTGLESSDIDRIRSIQDKTNVIPLLARSDELCNDTIISSKQHIRQQLDDNNLDIFFFSSSELDHDPLDVFAVSSATRPEPDVMDASILMNSGYVQPLVTTDLDQLVHYVFSLDGSSRLRHSAASKCIRWCREQNRSLYFQTALMRRDPKQSALTPVLTLNPFSQRQYWDAVEVLNWAQCLQHSLEAEQIHHWHQRQLAVESYRQQRTKDLARQQRKHPSKRKVPEPVNFTHQDPLGLLRMGSQLKKSGQLTFELLSSLGVVGCVAAWLTRPDWACQRGVGPLSRIFLEGHF